MDLLQSGKVNLVTVRKLLQEIISGNPQSPSEVGTQLLIYSAIFFYKDLNVNMVHTGL